MAIVVQRYEAAHEPAVEAFNQRLRAGGAPAYFVFPQHHVPRWLPPSDGVSVYNEMYVAVEGDMVRGAYILKRQDFHVAGGTRSLGYLHHPFSEGIVDTTYSSVGIQLIMDAQRREPLVHALGMDGYEGPLARVLLAMRWGHFAVPFYFRVERPARFLRRMRLLRSPWWRRAAADVLAVTGAGYLGVRAFQAGRSVAGGRDRSVTYDVEADFGEWCDGVWESGKADYSMTAVRDLQNLSTLYPRGNQQYSRLRVRRGSDTIGWAVVAKRHHATHPRYGDLRVGTVLDCFAAAGNARAVVRCATAELRSQGVDVIVSNQSHEAWCAGLEASGYFRGPSNFIFAAPQKLCALVDPLEQTKTRMHLTRGDGDGLYQYV